MHTSNQGRKDHSTPNDAVPSDDGIDPRVFFERREPHRRDDHKKEMLCAQVDQILRFVFDGELHDVDLQDVTVVAVEPLADGGTLRVTVSLPADGDIELTEAALARAGSFLRAEVAAGINRRRVPQLVFRVVHGDERGGLP